MEITELANEEYRKRRQRIMEMRRAGLKVTQIAAIEDVTPARIYQIIESESKRILVTPDIIQSVDSLPHPDGAQVVNVVTIKEGDHANL